MTATVGSRGCRAGTSTGTEVTDAHPQLSAATVHEAARRTGALPSTIKPLSPDMRLQAPAFPVRLPPGDNLWLHRAVYAATPGQVLVVDTGGGLEYGYWGEILAEAAMARHLAGLVIHGGVRDSLRLIAAGWPVFAERVCIQGTAKDPAGDGELGAPIVLGDVTVHLGDLIVGDADGIVCVPRDRIDQVRAASEDRDAAEVDYIARLQAGETTITVFQLP